MSDIHEFLKGFSRRQALKLSGLTLGGLAVGSKAAATCNPPTTPCYPTDLDTQRYKYYEGLPTMDYRQLPQAPGLAPMLTPPVEDNEMRIIFMGSCNPMARRAQALMSVFVEVGAGAGGKDHFLFDCGSGSAANYSTMGVGFSRMDKIFLNHLHGDHMSDLTHIYCFGPSGDRKSPLYVWGPSASGVRSPQPPRRLYDDGVNAFCRNFREAWRWHSESFAFQPTAYYKYPVPTKKTWGTPINPVPVGDDPPDDAFAVCPIELPWQTVGGVAYDNLTTGVKITHFPVIHCRRGALGYKLDWNGLSMVYTSDTKPEWNTVNMAKNDGNGIDVLIHEMVVPAEIWAMQNVHYTYPPADGGSDWELAVSRAEDIQDSSHTSQGAFGYMLSQIEPRPRLTIATHFPTSEDTIACALASINKQCPEITELGSKFVISYDLMVIRVFAGNPKPEIQQRRALVLDHNVPLIPTVANLKPPKYCDADGNPNPYAQIERATEITSGDATYCKSGY